MGQFTVKFKPQDKSIDVARGTDLLSAAIRCGIVMTASCGGEGLCGKCKCIIGKKKVLACQTQVESDLEVTIPDESIESHKVRSHAAEDFAVGAPLARESAFAFSPLVRKYHLELPEPTSEDNESDMDRIALAFSRKSGGTVRLSAHLAGMKHLSSLLRESDFKVTVSASFGEDADTMISVEPGDTSDKLYGLAFDIGTTTVAAQLVDLNTKKVLGARIAFNKQAFFGSDVITRIIYASDLEGLKKLNAAVLENINEMIEDLSGSCGVNPGDVYAVVFAGNMTMMHLLLSIDPSNIRKAPYIPASSTFPSVHAAEINVRTNPKGMAFFMPGVCTYIGGDIVAGTLACGLSESAEIALLVDIGTNGEIILGNKDWMIGAAASAGPAFEGSGLEYGMKATDGAIQKVLIDEKLNVRFDVIGGARAKGICGSGYIDLLCQMRMRGIMGRDGKLDRALKSARLRKGENVYEFVVTPANESAIGRDIVIGEDDIENLKRSKGAIYSAIISLVRKVEKRIQDVRKIYIAGGFGNYLNIESAIQIGLLPDVGRSVYEFIGNSSLAGARMALVSRDALRYAYDIYKNITYLDLSSEPGYMDEYIGALFFPHTDLGRFPSVR